MPSERRWAMGKIGKGEHSSTRFGARTRMFEADFGRSHGWRRPKAHRRVPLDKRVSRRYPTSVGRISGGEDLWCDLPKRAGLSKVTRPGPKGGRNPVEGSALASHAAKPHQGANRWLGDPARVCRRGADYFLRCNALRLLHPTVPPHQLRERPNTLRYSNLRAPLHH